MASLNDKLIADMKEAMKQKEAGKIRLSTIRLLRAAQKEAEVARTRELDDEEILELAVREVKKRKDAIPEYERAGRPEMIRQLHEEIAVLQTYLPEQIGEDELKRIVYGVIEETCASSAKDMGRVMQALMSRVKGRADGTLVSQLVKEMLK
ncbi:MAG TPA: GatB/YqeY domain-containing protein [Syntrophomonadaceae bacterium]|nr:GatB/YqeY domain-containing protein [Syntrophomonadaceae bacterium]